MAETIGLLNRRAVNAAPRVRIPPSPPIAFDLIDNFSMLAPYSHKRSPIKLALGEELAGQIDLSDAGFVPHGRK